jgi:hypothetical protein
LAGFFALSANVFGDRPEVGFGPEGICWTSKPTTIYGRYGFDMMTRRRAQEIECNLALLS